MIPRTADWKNALASAVRDPAELLALLELPRELLEPARAAAANFPLRVPRGLLSLMEKGNPADPLLRQVLPLGEEQLETPDFIDDPVGDTQAQAVPGLLHKYQGRALLTLTGACAVHCRYCFRRHYPYAEQNPCSEQWRPVLEYLQGDASIDELILSGGDPLLLDDNRLGELNARLDALPQLKRLRIHSRLPVVLPERIDDALLGWLGQGRLQKVLVIHANHPRELGPAALEALARLRVAGVSLLNQSVLLKGVNDDADTLSELSERLFEAGVQPYYLHLLDRVRGAAHFEVDEARARGLYHQLHARLSGYLLPRLVRELPGEAGKRPLLP